MPSRFRRVLAFTFRYWLLSPRLFAALVVARILSTLVDVTVPFAAGRFVDTLTGTEGRDPGPALWALGLVLVLSVLQTGRQVVTFLLNRVSVRACSAILLDAFARVQRFSSEWHANTFAGATVRRITRGMWAYDTFSDTVALGIVPTFIVVVGVVAVFTWRWPVLGLVVALTLGVFMVVTTLLNVRWVRPAFRVARELDSQSSGYIADAISGSPTVKSFAAESREDAGLAALMERWRDKTIIAWDRGATTGVVQALLMIVMMAGMFGTGLWLWTNGRASAGDVAGLISAQFVIAGYMRDLAQQIRNLQRSLNEMEDLISFEEQAAGQGDPPGAETLVVRDGHVAFENVTFHYNGAAAPLFEDLTIDIPAGQHVGLVGHSGAGKSTFVKLIQRLYEPQSGRITIDGQNIADVTLDSLRHAVGLVPQDPVLFHRSLVDNIAYGQPGATPEEAAEAARLAHADRFIEALPTGYATLVGERGIKLSGGERQRVAIARALLAATPILVLDEATSSLDSLSEMLIRDAIDRLSAGRTAIVIAHRLSTVRRLDRILVFDGGRVVQDGTHAELVARPGLYRDLTRAQMEDAADRVLAAE